jgi:hypothetical protein
LPIRGELTHADDEASWSFEPAEAGNVRIVDDDQVADVGREPAQNRVVKIAEEVEVGRVVGETTTRVSTCVREGSVMSVGEERRRSSGDDDANFVAVRQPLGRLQIRLS